MAKVSLVTVLFNSDGVLDGFLKSLSIQSFTDYHLYLIDNTVNDNTDKLLKELTNSYGISNYTHIKNPDNAGIARGNNQGIDLSLKADAAYTLLLNNDIEFSQPCLLENIVSHADKYAEPIITPKIYFYDDKKVWMAGGRFSIYKGTSIHVGEGSDDGPLYENEAYFDYAPTCFMLINNSVFEKIGMMDEKYFVYYDDTDFMYRACQKGYKVKLLPQLHVYHKVSSLTGGGESLFTIYYGIRNRIYFISKNFNGFNYVFAMLFTLSTRVFKYLRYDKQQRKRLLTGITAGFELLK